jgi:DNA-directed RNA polymerase specialized sigma24 family protein
VDEEFGHFVAARSRALCRTAYLLTGDWQVGEDLVQEALTRTYLRRRRLRSASALEPYTRKVLVSLFLSSRRRLWHRELPFAAVPDQASNGEASGRRASRWPTAAPEDRACLRSAGLQRHGPGLSALAGEGAARPVPSRWRSSPGS